MALTDAPTPRPSGHRDGLRDTIRALMGITRTNQTALARVLGVGQPNLSKRLGGVVPFSEDDLALIATYFYLDSPADLYDTPRAVSLCAERCPKSRWIYEHPGQGSLLDLLVAA